MSKPEISSENQQVDPAILSPLLENLGTLSSVFHVLPENFIKTKYITHDEDLPPIAPLPVDISDTLKQSYSAPTPSVDQSQITSSNPFRTNVSPTTTTTTTSTVSMVAPPQPLEAPNPFIPPTSPQEAHPQVYVFLINPLHFALRPSPFPHPSPIRPSLRPTPFTFHPHPSPIRPSPFALHPCQEP